MKALDKLAWGMQDWTVQDGACSAADAREGLPQQGGETELTLAAYPLSSTHTNHIFIK